MESNSKRLESNYKKLEFDYNFLESNSNWGKKYNQVLEIINIFHVE